MGILEVGFCNGSIFVSGVCVHLCVCGVSSVHTERGGEQTVTVDSGAGYPRGRQAGRGDGES